MAHMLPQLIL